MVNAVQHQPPTPLEYSRPPALAWVVRWRRVLIVLAVAIAVGIPGYRNWGALSQRARWLYWNHRCATFQMPADVEVWVGDPQRARQLLATDRDYVLARFPSLPGAVYSPLPWRMLKAVDGRCDWIGEPFFGRGVSDPIAFIGSRRRPDGIWRLVVVSGGQFRAGDLLADTSVLVLPPPGLLDPLPRPVAGGAFGYNGAFEPAEMRGGVADPNDPSHITFTVVTGFSDQWAVGRFRGIIDAYLENDDSLSFELRYTPRLGVSLGRDRISGVIPKDRVVDGRLRPFH